MKEALVFNGINALDFVDIRHNVLRIPEVSRRITQAQSVLDHMQEMPLDLQNFLGSDNEVYLNSIKLKSLAAAVVQVGLYDRYLRFHPEPTYFVGNSNGDSSLMVSLEELSLEEMVMHSQALVGTHSVVSLTLAKAPLLSGISLTEYAVFRLERDDDARSIVKPVAIKQVNLNKILMELIDKHGVAKIVSIGPGFSSLSGVESEFALRDIQVLESIDLDPMLSWFWPGVKFQQARAASSQ
jgi:hypothetical protein